ncbi:MAG: hypothetical protein WC866_03675 [Patescibacteria group bacterium]|jgi:hypothetical protein
MRSTGSVASQTRPRPRRSTFVLIGIMTVPLTLILPMLTFGIFEGLCGLEFLHYLRSPSQRKYALLGLALCAMSLLQIAVCLAGLAPIIAWTPFT